MQQIFILNYLKHSCFFRRLPRSWNPSMCVQRRTQFPQFSFRLCSQCLSLVRHSGIVQCHCVAFGKILVYHMVCAVVRAHTRGRDAPSKSRRRGSSSPASTNTALSMASFLRNLGLSFADVGFVKLNVFFGPMLGIAHMTVTTWCKSEMSLAAVNQMPGTSASLDVCDRWVVALPCPPFPGLRCQC
jgi:hypothetical protein